MKTAIAILLMAMGLSAQTFTANDGRVETNRTNLFTCQANPNYYGWVQAFPARYRSPVALQVQWQPIPMWVDLIPDDLTFDALSPVGNLQNWGPWFFDSAISKNTNIQMTLPNEPTLIGTGFFVQCIEFNVGGTIYGVSPVWPFTIR